MTIAATTHTRRNGHRALKHPAARRGHQTETQTFEQCLAGLGEAIALAESSIATQERRLVDYDHRTKSAVARLVAEGRVRPTLAWDPVAA